MNKKRTLSLVAALISAAGFAQESAQADITLIKPEIKLSYLDSVKSTFVRHQGMAKIDSLWMKEMANDDLYANMQEDLARINPDEEVDYSLDTELLKKRLARLDAKSPFNIEYSKGLENIIKAYLKNRSRSYERLMAISEYYFPMFEEHLAKYNVPLEIKYLAVIESALNPRAKSRVGAAGLWQFMYPTGKQYNLEVNSYVDERADPLKATEAACQYLTSLYNIFGDWDLVLASYNAGPGNVTKAIRRSGSYKNYWNIRKNLPKETQAYNPTFLATMYIYEYAKEHGIKAKKAPLTYFETDTIMVKRQMSFKQLANVLDVPVGQLQFLNPIYKLDVIPYTTEKAHFLRLPKDKVGLFASNENAIYAYIDHEDSKRERPRFSVSPDREEAVASNYKRRSYKKTSTVSTKVYTVKRGDNLGAICAKYGVSLAEVKKWNRIKGNTINAGQRIKILKNTSINVPVVTEEAIAATTDKISETRTEKAAKAASVVKEPAVETENAIADCDAPTTAENRSSIASASKRRASTYEEARLYVVQKGDSLFSIARKHPGVTVENLKKWNEIKDESIQPGMKLKVGDIN